MPTAVGDRRSIADALTGRQRRFGSADVDGLAGFAAEKMPVMSFGLVLGAGGTLGEAYHRGVLRALHERGFDAREAAVVVGTSAGSIVAAAIRRQSTATPAALTDRAPRRRLVPDRTEALRLVRRPRQALNALLLTPELMNGRIPTTFLADALRRAHGTTWPDAALWIVAVRRDSGARVVFGKPGEPTTDVASAVAASCAIPGYFQAVDIDGTTYVDGGVHSPTNADVLAPLDLDLVIISSPMSMEPRQARARLDLPLRWLCHRYLRAEVWSLKRSGDRVVTIEPDAAVLGVMGVNMMSGRHADEVEERAYTLALRRLALGPERQP